MCTYYSRLFTWAQVAALSPELAAAEQWDKIDPLPRVRPQQLSPVLRNDGGRLAMHEIQWGISLPIAEYGDTLRTTAPLRTARTDRAFLRAWGGRRCLIPASGYFTRRHSGDAVRPFWVNAAFARVVMFAGLWDEWQERDGTTAEGFAIVTCPTFDGTEQLDPDTPLMLPPAAYRRWLFGTEHEARGIAQSVTLPMVRWHPLGEMIGAPELEPELLTRADVAGLGVAR